ncbi:MAG: replicative DNA helicase [Bdellovibrionales bacterium RIFOXYD1_FULL_53_11]|nr:MAG: replicative DNA helicase [Bdellovibrionales bacterium RIFOXYD1_FULL_53_11]
MLGGDLREERLSQRGGSAGVPVSGGRVPPHNLEAERSVLGAVLVQNEAIHKVADVGLEHRDFYKDSHKKIFETLHALSERGEPVDLVTLTSALRDKGWFESVGGTAALTGLFEDTFAVGNVVYYAKIVREKALLRRMIDTAVEIAGDAFEGIENVEEYLDECERKVFSVSDVKLTRSFSSMQEILVDNMHSIEALADRNETVTGLATGFNDFDRLTSGLHPGQLAIIAGRPAMGKTSLVLSIAQYAAIAKDAVIALFSLEMSKEELGFRFLSGVSRIEAKRLKVGRVKDREDWTRLTEAAGKLSKARIFIDDSGDLTVMDMRARCRRLYLIHKRIDLIVVDYLQLMKGSKAASRGDSSREREISEISRNLKALAKELKVPIIALSQLNRGLESRQDKRPMLSDLRESGAIEQDADIVCFVYRDEVYNPDSEDRGLAELIVSKHRAGETGMIPLKWLSQYTLFANFGGFDGGAGAGTPVIRKPGGRHPGPDGPPPDDF